MHQVGRGVIKHGGTAQANIDLGIDRITNLDFAFDDLPVVAIDTGLDLLRVCNPESGKRTVRGD